MTVARTLGRPKFQACRNSRQPEQLLSRSLKGAASRLAWVNISSVYRPRPGLRPEMFSMRHSEFLVTSFVPLLYVL